MAMFGLFLHVPWSFEISRKGWDQVQGTTLPLYLFKISDIGLKISGMMHSTMKQIAI